MKKLLFLINTLDGGGAERVLCNTANALCREKYDITVCTVADRGVFKSRLDSDVHYKSIVRIKNAYLRNLCVYLISFVLPAGFVHRMFVGNSYDHEIAFLEGVPTRIIGASGNRRSKKYAWVHTDLCNNHEQKKAFKSEAEQLKAYKHYDKIVCVSEGVRRAFIKRFGDLGNTEVKYNIIDDNAVKAKASEPVERTDKTRIVSVGRLVEEKGYDRFLRIVKKLCDDGFEFEVILIGEGSQRAELEEFINKYELPVKLKGFSNNPYKYMHSADFLVFPSRAEGFSTAATEAVILGKPIIATECSGMRELLGDSQYGIVTDNNEDSVYDAVRRMLTDKELRNFYGKKAEKRSVFFSKEKRIEEIEQLFEE